MQTQTLSCRIPPILTNGDCTVCLGVSLPFIEHQIEKTLNAAVSVVLMSGISEKSRNTQFSEPGSFFLYLLFNGVAETSKFHC